MIITEPVSSLYAEPANLYAHLHQSITRKR